MQIGIVNASRFRTRARCTTLGARLAVQLRRRGIRAPRVRSIERRRNRYKNELRWSARSRRLLLKDLLLQANAAVNAAKAGNWTRLDDKTACRFSRRYRKMIAQALAANPPPEPTPGKRGKPKDSKASISPGDSRLTMEKCRSFFFGHP